MTLTRRNTTTFSLALAAALLASGCKSNNQQATNPPQSPNQQTQPAPNQPGQQAMNPGSAPVQQPPAQQQPYAPRDRDRDRDRDRQGYAPGQQQGYAPQERTASLIPAGTHIVVTLGQTISTKTSQPGDSFAATVAEPVVVRGATLIRAGAQATGTVVDSKSLGRFKGQAELAIRLDTVRAEGRTYQVASSTVDRMEKGKGKRTAELTGGGTGLGAIIGGIAGGGKGALIGGLAGAGAGGAGSAFTGNKELTIPAETELTFRLERDVSLR